MKRRKLGTREIDVGYKSTAQLHTANIRQVEIECLPNMANGEKYGGTCAFDNEGIAFFGYA